MDQSAVKGTFSDAEKPTESSGASTQYVNLTESIERLQQLQRDIIGGEQVGNEMLMERRRQRKKIVDQAQVRLIQAQSKDSEESENVHVKLKAAKQEIQDLNEEFQVEREDCMAMIRQQERERQLMQGLLERMVLLVPSNCNYSNLDRLKKEAVWDEDSVTWRLPDVIVQKTVSAVPQKPPPEGEQLPCERVHQPGPSDAPPLSPEYCRCF